MLVRLDHIGIVSPTLDSYEPLQAELDDFLGAIQEKRAPRVDGHSGLRVVRVLEAAQHSLEHGGEPVNLTWDETQEATRQVRVR